MHVAIAIDGQRWMLNRAGSSTHALCALSRPGVAIAAMGTIATAGIRFNTTQTGHHTCGSSVSTQRGPPLDPLQPRPAPQVPRGTGDRPVHGKCRGTLTLDHRLPGPARVPIRGRQHRSRRRHGPCMWPEPAAAAQPGCRLCFLQTRRYHGGRGHGTCTGERHVYCQRPLADVEQAACMAACMAACIAVSGRVLGVHADCAYATRRRGSAEAQTHGDRSSVC